MKGKCESNDIDDSIGIRVDGMVVLSQDERVGMDESGGRGGGGGSGGSNDPDDWNRGNVDDVAVSCFGRGRWEWVGMDASSINGFADIDGWGWRMVDGEEVSGEGERTGINDIGGCEGCTKLDARGTCRWPTRRPHLP